MSGRFQSEFDAFLAYRFPVKGLLVRLSRQADLWISGKMPSPGGTKIDSGIDNWLFEHEYVRHHVKRFPMDEREAGEVAEKLRFISGEISRLGKAFAVVISPSKAEIYPEMLTSAHRPTAENLKSKPAAETLREKLAAGNMPVVDATHLFKEWKKDGALLFPKNGTHWNAYGAQKILSETIRACNIKGMENFPSVTGHIPLAPLKPDRDLSALYNLFFYPHREKEVPYPVLQNNGPPRKRLKVLGIGDSFCFQLADAMGRCGFVSEFRFLYYNKAEYLFSWDKGEQPIQNRYENFRLGPKTIDLDSFIELAADADLVIMEFNEIFSRDLSWLFPKNEPSAVSSQGFPK